MTPTDQVAPQAAPLANVREGGRVRKIRGIRALTHSDDFDDFDDVPDDGADAQRNQLHGTVNFFDDWTPESVREIIKSECWQARLYRKIAILAGLVRPLSEADYKRGLQKYDGDEEKFLAKFPVTNPEKFLTGYQLNSEKLPFDIYQLFRESRRSFMVFLILLYFVVHSTIFTLLALGTGCLAIDITPWNFLCLGFLMLSGVGDTVLNGTGDACIVINSVAIFIGVYISLPVIGAIVLVRLLDNKADLIVCSDVILLTVRNGVPQVSVRIASASGTMLRNVTSSAELWLYGYDETNADQYLEQQLIEFVHPKLLGHYPMHAKHVCDEDSVLIKKGAVVVDENGVPSWNPKKLCFIAMSFDAERSKGCNRFFGWNPRVFIGPNERGQNPFYMNGCPVSHFHWLKYKGKVSPFSDIRRLSMWEYKSKEFRPPSEEPVDFDKQ